MTPLKHIFRCKRRLAQSKNRIIIIMKIYFVLIFGVLVGCSRKDEPVPLPSYSIVNEIVGDEVRQVINLTNGMSLYFSKTNLVIWPSTNSSIVVVFDPESRAIKSTMLKLPAKNGEPDQAVLDINADGVPDLRKRDGGLGNEIFFQGEWYGKRNKGNNVIITNGVNEIEVRHDGRRYVEVVK